MKKKFKIKGVGLDTTTITETPVSGVYPNPDYVFTSISANNDYLLSDYLKSIKSKYSLITEIDFLDESENILQEHLKTIGLEKIDLLLLPDTLDWNLVMKKITVLEDDKVIENFGVYNPSSLDKLKEIQKIVKNSGKELEFISLNISPLEYNHDILEYVENEDILVFGFNPIGGFLSAPRNIKAFSLPYLLGFSAYNSDIVMLSGRNIYESWKSSEYLKKLVGKEGSPKYICRKNVSRNIKPLKRLIGTSVNINPGTIIPYTEDTFLMDPNDITITLGNPVSQYPVLKATDEKDNLVKEINHYLESIHFPSDSSKQDDMAVVRYKLTDYLEIEYPKDSGWKFGYLRFGNTVMAISIWRDPVPKRWFWSSGIPGERHSFFLAMPEGRDNIIFIKDVEKEPEEG